MGVVEIEKIGIRSRLFCAKLYHTSVSGETTVKTTRCYVHLLSLLLLITTLSPAQTTPAETKGAAIGQTINAAITAALPGVSAIENIVAALFKKPAGTVAPTATTRVTAQNVTDAVKGATATLQSNAQAQLTALQGAIAEIAAANALATAAQTANTSLTPARAFLTIPDGMRAFKTQWGVAKQNLKTVTSFDSSKLGKISSESILDAWNLLNQNYTQWESDVDLYSSQTPPNLALVLSSFDKLLTSVQGIATIPSVELSLLANQLSTIKAQAAIGTGTPPPPPPPPATLLNAAGSLGEFIKSTVKQ
jgi:hypothetical protein